MKELNRLTRDRRRADDLRTVVRAKLSNLDLLIDAYDTAIRALAVIHGYPQIKRRKRQTLSGEEAMYVFVEDGSIVIDAATGTVTKDKGQQACVINPRGYRQVQVYRDGFMIACQASRLIWRHVHGPIPPNMRLVYRNGDLSDLRIDNLNLASFGESLRRKILEGGE